MLEVEPGYRPSLVELAETASDVMLGSSRERHTALGARR